MQVAPISINNYSSQNFSTPSFQGLTVKKETLKTLGYKSKNVLLNEVPTLKTLSKKANIAISRIKRDKFDEIHTGKAIPSIAGGLMTTLLGAVTMTNSPVVGGILLAAGLGGSAYGFGKLATPSYDLNIEVNDYEKDEKNATRSFTICPELPLEESFRNIQFRLDSAIEIADKKKKDVEEFMNEINAIKNNTSKKYTKAKKKADVEKIKDNLIASMKKSSNIPEEKIKAFEEVAKDYPDILNDFRQTYEKRLFERKLAEKRFQERMEGSNSESFRNNQFRLDSFIEIADKKKKDVEEFMNEINAIKNNKSKKYTKAKKKADVEKIKDNLIASMKKSSNIPEEKIKAFEEVAKDYPDVLNDFRQTYEKRLFEIKLAEKRFQERMRSFEN